MGITLRGKLTHWRLIEQGFHGAVNTPPPSILQSTGQPLLAPSTDILFPCLEGPPTKQLQLVASFL